MVFTWVRMIQLKPYKNWINLDDDMWQRPLSPTKFRWCKCKFLKTTSWFQQTLNTEEGSGCPVRLFISISITCPKQRLLYDVLYCLFSSLAVGWNSLLTYVGCPAVCQRPVMFVKDVNNCLYLWTVWVCASLLSSCMFTTTFVYPYDTHTPR